MQSADQRRVPRTAGRRWPRHLLVLLLATGSLLASGTLAGALWYARATTPDRSAPDVVADNYLRALLVEQNAAQASLWACADRSKLAEIESYRNEIGQAEARLSARITVSWGPLTIQDRSANAATLLVELRRSATVDSIAQSVTDRFHLHLVDDDGWRVCATRRLPD